MNNYVKALERILILEDRIKAIEKNLNELNKRVSLWESNSLWAGTAPPVTKDNAESGSW